MFKFNLYIMFILCAALLSVTSVLLVPTCALFLMIFPSILSPVVAFIVFGAIFLDTVASLL